MPKQMTDPAPRYSLGIKGEQHIFSVEAWNDMDADHLCAVLADLTGYRADFLRADLPSKFDRLGYAQITAADTPSDSVPKFFIRSHDGRKMPLEVDAR